MSGNTESTSNSIKCMPMPMSALLASLMLPQNENTVDTPDSSYTDDSDSSLSEGAAIKAPFGSNIIKHSTPQFKISKNANTFSSERKAHEKEGKENNDSNFLSYRALTVRESRSVQKPAKSTFSTSEIKNQNVFKHNNNIQQCNTQHNSNCASQQNNVPTNNKPNSAINKSPEMAKGQTSTRKTKTPKIKSGIRKFTPGSAKNSHKKISQPPVLQNRDKVRCELFGKKQKDNPPPPEPAPMQAPVAVPATPLNKKALPSSYVATPSYPQGIATQPGGKNSKILFKTTSIKGKKYMFIKKLGIGGSSEVYKVLEVESSFEYAVKCVNLATDQELAQGYVNEVRLLRKLQNSDRVIKLYDYEYDRSNQFLRLVLEMGETDLSSFLRARGAGLPPALVLHYWEEMLHAVGYIHENGVIHADLKPANFLLVCGRLKLIDFGIASAISGDATSVVRAQAAGTYSYISPEALMGGAGGYSNSADIKISFKSDVWSLGCILYSMVYGRTPFGHIPNLAKLAVILDPHHRIDYAPVTHLPPSLISALKWCLTYNSRARPSVQELLSLRHLQPANSTLPESLLDRLKSHVSQKEYRLLQQARI